jgi:hypothetical protein
MTDTGTKPFGEYGFAIRTFWVKGTELTVSRRWVRQAFSDPEAGDRFSTSIIGKAISEKDNVGVIGREGRETKEFSLTIKSDADAAREWERIRRLEELAIKNDGTTPELRVRANIFEALGKNPPTAALFVTEDDWEIGSKGGWSIECAVPSPVLAQLEAELLTQRAHELYLGIEWEGGLVRDEHAPPSFPTSWGLFTTGERQTPEPLHGHVKLFGWRVSNEPAALGEPLPGPQEQPLAPERSVDDVNRFGPILARQIVALASVCIIGFLATLLLIVIGHFLR